MEPDAALRRVNASFAARLGYSSQELQGASLLSLTHPDEVAASRELMRSLLASERPSLADRRRNLDRRAVTARRSPGFDGRRGAGQHRDCWLRTMKVTSARIRGRPQKGAQKGASERGASFAIAPAKT